MNSEHLKCYEKKFISTNVQFHSKIDSAIMLYLQINPNKTKVLLDIKHDKEIEKCLRVNMLRTLNRLSSLL